MFAGQLYAGDYVLVWGELDEDGYLEAELLDGRRGLVSSSCIVFRVVNEQFHSACVIGRLSTKNINDRLFDFSKDP